MISTTANVPVLICPPKPCLRSLFGSQFNLKRSLILENRGEFAEAAGMLEHALSTPNQTRVQYLNLIEVLLRQGLADSAQVVQ